MPPSGSPQRGPALIYAPNRMEASPIPTEWLLTCRVVPRARCYLEGGKALDIVVNLRDALFHLERIGIGLPDKGVIRLCKHIVEKRLARGLSQLVRRHQQNLFSIPVYCL